MYYLLSASKSSYCASFEDIFFLTFVRPFAKGTVFHFHAGGLAEYLNSLKNPLRFLARLAYSKPDVGIAISKSQLEDINAFLPKSKIVIPNGLDVPDDVTAGSKKEEGLKRILYVAGLRKSKGVLDLITTAEKLKQMKVDFIIDVVGSWQEPETENIFYPNYLKKVLKKTLIHGKLTGQDKWNLYHSASVFFFPSYYESENFPLGTYRGNGFWFAYRKYKVERNY